MTINPNYLTLSRLAAGPLFLALFPVGDWWARVVCALIVAGAIVSDYYDGKLARAQKKVSLFGKFFDPLTDFLFFVTVFLAFWQAGIVPLWMVSLVAIRELAMHTGLRPYFAVIGVDPGARWSGKLKTTCQCVFTMLVCLHRCFPVQYQWGWFNAAATLLFGAVVLLSWLSLAEYVMSLRGVSASRQQPV